MILHGYRKVTGYPPHQTLGRETSLVSVSWPKGSWLIVNGNGTVPIDMTHPTLPLHTYKPKAPRTEFTEKLGLEWNFIQLPEEEFSSKTKRKVCSV